MSTKTMLWILSSVLVSVLHLSSAHNETVCDGLDAKTFNFRDVLGSWYVAGIVTYGEKLSEKANPCFRVEFSEADEGGLKWLIQNQTHLNHAVDPSQSMKGTAIRQRYHIDYPYDTWSRTLEGVKGCFEEVLTLYSDDDHIFTQKTKSNKKEMMQLHLLNTEDGLGPYLLQLLWGDVVSSVIYRRRPGRVTRQELEPSLEMLNKLRSNHTLAHLCEHTPTKPRNESN